MQKSCEDKHKEIGDLKLKLKEKNNFQSNIDMDLRMQNLTDALMAKQSTLETITSERNALCIQLEKLERDYNKLLQCQKNKVVYSSINDLEEGLLLYYINQTEIRFYRKLMFQENRKYQN